MVLTFVQSNQYHTIGIKQDKMEQKIIDRNPSGSSNVTLRGNVANAPVLVPIRIWLFFHTHKFPYMCVYIYIIILYKLKYKLLLRTGCRVHVCSEGMP